MTSVAEMLRAAKAHHQAGQLAEAEQLYRRILQADPRQAEALHLLGLIAHQVGRRDVAIDYMTAAIALDASQPSFHSNLGEVYRGEGRLAEAQACYQRAVRLQPRFAAAHYNLGLLFQNQGLAADAEHCYRQAIAAQGDYAEAYNNLAAVLRDQARYVDALEACQAALRLRGDYAEALNNLGGVLVDLRRFDEALAPLKQSLALQGESAEVYYNLGNALRGTRQVGQAAACYHEALRLQPDFVMARSNLATLLWDEGHLAPAAQMLEALVEEHPDLNDARNNLGSVYQYQGRAAEAAASFEEVLRRDPEYRQVRYNLGMVYLTQGRFAEGWEQYQWRYGAKVQPREFTQPAWDGSSIAGQRILLHAEQGLGDTIQFVRYAPLVEKTGATVIIESQPALVPLLNASGFANVVAHGDPLGQFDVQALLASLPGIVGTRLDTIPSEVPYLRADPRLVELWRERLAAIDGYRVGICWQGNTEYLRDRWRSIPLVEFSQLAEVPGVRLISLQRRDGLEQLANASSQFSIVELGRDVDAAHGAFMDTAAIMQHLDLVVTSDTATAHLAGALGVPVWVALAHAAEWRWLADRDDSPWYPTMRLFRQLEWNEWTTVFRRMATALAARVIRRG